MATQFEEIVVNTKIFDVQDLAPDLSQQVLRRVAGSDILSLDLKNAGPTVARRLQGLSIDLAIRCERQGVQLDERRWNHVVRKLALQETPKARGAQLASRCRDDERDEPLVSGHIFPDLDRNSSNLRMSQQKRFNLFELDPVSPDFDLSIGTSHIFEGAIRRPSGHITRAVEAGTWLHAERIGNKPLRGQIGTLQVATSQTDATDIEFSRDPDGGGPHMAIEHVHLNVLNRATYGDLWKPAADVGGRQVAYGRCNRHFGRTVGVQQPHAGADTLLPGHQGLRERPFSADDHRVNLWGNSRDSTRNPAVSSCQ